MPSGLESETAQRQCFIVASQGLLGQAVYRARVIPIDAQDHTLANDFLLDLARLSGIIFKFGHWPSLVCLRHFLLLTAGPIISCPDTAQCS